ncbi:odorant receptor 10-like [Megachile rotundata]|uniref:odorant receptor 10-like n=1 Tax=Megachile rotundata TaxID=143995 RepID=UPI003FD5BEAB
MQKAPAKSRAGLPEQDYLKNVDLSVRLNRWILKPIAAWPESSTVSPVKKYLSWFVHVVCYFLMSFLFVPCLIFLILEVNGTYNRIKLFGPLSSPLMSYSKYYLLLLHKNDILKCVKQIEWDWRNMKHLEEKRIMVANANYARRIVIVCTFFMCSSYMFFYIAVPITVGRIPAQDGNFTFILLPFPSPMRITDYRQSPVNEIFYFLQCLAGILLRVITAGACSLAATFAVHACGQMEILMNWLGYLVNGRADMSKNLDGRIARIVEQHVRILRFLELTEKTLRYISLVEFLGCTVELCLLGYCVLMEWNSNDRISSATYAVLFVSFTCNIFIYCYIGELVAEGCRKIAEISYMIDWHRLLGKRKLSMILIMQMSHSTIKLTAGNIAVLSYRKFGDVVKSAFAFLNVLRTVT